MIYVYNPSPVALQISVNHVLVANAVVALPAPDYTPQSMAVPYGPTGDMPPPASYPLSQPHFVPNAKNILFTEYVALDPNVPTLGLKFTFENFVLSTPVQEDLLFYCFRNRLLIFDQFGTRRQDLIATA